MPSDFAAWTINFSAPCVSFPNGVRSRTGRGSGLSQCGFYRPLIEKRYDARHRSACFGRERRDFKRQCRSGSRGDCFRIKSGKTRLSQRYRREYLVGGELVSTLSRSKSEELIAGGSHSRRNDSQSPFRIFHTQIPGSIKSISSTAG